MKLTAVALALIAAAAFTTSANAAIGTTGDLILGIYDTSLSNSNSLEVSLGLNTTLPTNGGTETWDLTSAEIADVTSGGSTLAFSIAATGGSVGTSSLVADEDLVSSPVAILSSAVGAASTAESNINGLITGSGASVGSTPTAIEVANSNTKSFKAEVNNNTGDFGLTSGNITGNGSILAPLSTSVTLYDINPTADTVSALGTFSFNTGTDVLTYNAIATPEPSTYALMIGGLLALWVIKRRRSNA